MPARPTVGMVFLPEYYRGTAEDRYRILDLSAKVTTPYGSFSNVLVMSEQTRLEPGVLGLKYHARGFGQIKESTPRDQAEPAGGAAPSSLADEARPVRRDSRSWSTGRCPPAALMPRIHSR
jgi:hypothetical protein